MLIMHFLNPLPSNEEYLPVNKPPASGLYTITLIPHVLAAGMSSGTQVWFKAFINTWQTEGTTKELA